MTLYEFNALEKIEQVDAVFEHGVLVADLILKDFKLPLYQIDYSFYIEVSYNS